MSSKPIIFRTRPSARRARKRYYYRKRGALYSAGLTTRGTQRRYAFHPEIANLHGIARKRGYQGIFRRARVAKGLTTKGTERVNKLRPQFAHLPQPERKRAYQRLWLQERYDRGLTARGTPSRHAPSAKELAWRELRATMDIPTTDFLTTAERTDY